MNKKRVIVLSSILIISSLMSFSVFSKDYEFPELTIVLIDKTTKKPLVNTVYVKPSYKKKCLPHAATILTGGEECYISEDSNKDPVKTVDGKIVSPSSVLKKKDLTGYGPLIDLQINDITCKGQEWHPGSCNVKIPLDKIKGNKTITIEVEQVITRSNIETFYRALFDVNNPCHIECLEKNKMRDIDPKDEKAISNMPICQTEARKVIKNQGANDKIMMGLFEELQLCFATSNVKCINECKGSKEIFAGQGNKTFDVDTKTGDIKSGAAEK